MSKLSSEGLFRQQALAYQKNRLAGDIVVAQPVSFSTITALLLISLAVTALFLWLGEYSRKEVVRGYLVPSKGFLKIYTPRMANVEILHVKEGEQVAEGQPLVTLITERSLANGVDAGESRVQQVELQIRSLENQLAQIKELHVKQLSELSDSKGFLSQELVELAQQAEALEARNVIYQEQLQDIESVYQQGHVTKSDYLYQKQQLLVAKQEWQELKAIIIKERLSLKQLEYRLVKLPHEYHQQEFEYHRKISALKQQKMTEETNYKLVLRASSAGVIAAIQIKEGEHLTDARPLMTLLPDNAKLQAELWLPTKASGFVALGQETRLRFDAFPHQRFGSIDGQVALISKSITNPQEARLPVQLDEPVYRVIAEINDQALLAYGKQLPLQAGMLLEADIVLERRNLLDWLLDPLYSLKGRV